MPFDGNGLFNRVHNWVTDKANSIKINASRMDEEFDGVATALSTCITRDGQTVVTGDLPMAAYRHTGVGNASARNQYAAAGQVQDGAFSYAAGGGSADAQTLTLSPAITAYAAGQIFRFLPNVSNATATPTLAVNGLSAKTIKKAIGTGIPGPLDAGDLDDATVALVAFDGTQFQLLNPQSGVPYVGGQKAQGFDLQILDNAGTIEHRIRQAGGVNSNFADKITGATSGSTTTPTGADGSTAFAGGGTISSAATNTFILDTADQVVADQIASAVVQVNDSGTAIVVDVNFTSRDVNGTTRIRPEISFYDAASAAGFALTPANIGSNGTIVRLTGYLA